MGWSAYGLSRTRRLIPPWTELNWTELTASGYKRTMPTTLLLPFIHHSDFHGKDGRELINNATIHTQNNVVFFIGQAGFCTPDKEVCDTKSTFSSLLPAVEIKRAGTRSNCCLFLLCGWNNGLFYSTETEILSNQILVIIWRQCGGLTTDLIWSVKPIQKGRIYKSETWNQ